MFSLELVRPWTLNVRKMVRPERSGVLANLLVYALLGSSAASSVAPALKPEESSKAELDKRYRVVMLGPGKSKDKICVCHIDVRFKGKSIEHLRDQLAPTCDNDYTQPREWTDPPHNKSIPWPHNVIAGQAVDVMIHAGGKEYRMNHGDGEFRWHCEGPNPSPLTQQEL